MEAIILKGFRTMPGLRISLTKLFVVLSLSLGRMPRLVAVLDLFRTPPVARVLLTRKRNLTYTDFFTLLDRDGRRAAPIARAARDSRDIVEERIARERYISVDAA
jgi:hypothetical protein